MMSNCSLVFFNVDVPLALAWCGLGTILLAMDAEVTVPRASIIPSPSASMSRHLTPKDLLHSGGSGRDLDPIPF
jgi:hypothetical protein